MTDKTTDIDLFKIAANQIEGIGRLLDRIDTTATEKLIEMILRAKRIFVTGSGRSSLLTGWFTIRLMQMGFDVHVPGEVTCPSISKGDLLLAVSCSGTTTTTIDLARIAAGSGAEVAAITAFADSSLADYADNAVILPVAERDLIKSYKYGIGPCNNTLFEQTLIVYFDSMVYLIIERQGISEQQISKRHANLE